MTTKIYQKIKKHWEKSQFKSYRYQDIDSCGLIECEEIYLKEPINAQQKNEKAKGLLEVLINILNEELEPAEVENYINKFPVIQYYFVLIDKLKILLNEGVITDQQLLSLGTEYATNFENVEIIKLGLTLLRFAKTDEALELLKVFSCHNEFIFYAVEGLKEYKYCNTNIFNVAKGSRGYGRILSITNLEPISYEIKQWLMEEGSSGGFLDPVIVAMIYNEIDYLTYFEQGEKGFKKFNSLTKNLFTLSEIDEFFIQNISFQLCALYWSYYEIYGGDFNSRYIMGLLISKLIDAMEADSDSAISIFFVDEEEELFTSIVEKYMSENHQLEIKKAIKNRVATISKILELSELLDVKLGFKDLKTSLENDKYNQDIYEYIMSSKLYEDKRQLLHFCIDNKIFDEVMTGDENVDEDAINEEFIIDSCLFSIVSKNEDLYEESLKFNINALKARYKPIRSIAISNISKFEKEIICKYTEEINQRIKAENDITLKKQLLRLIDKNILSDIKFKNIDELVVQPHVKDIVLTSMDLDGKEYSNLIQKHDEQSIIILKREILNINNDTAIMMINENGDFAGYVPNEKSEILSNLMDNGKILYGRSEKREDGKSITLSILLSYTDVINEVTNTLNMVTDMKIGYIN